MSTHIEMENNIATYVRISATLLCLYLRSWVNWSAKVWPYEIF